MKILLESDVNSFPDALAVKLQNLPNIDSQRVFEALSWLGVFSLSEPFNDMALSVNDASVRPESLLDAFCALLQRKLAFQPDERDLVILTHKFMIELCKPSSSSSPSSPSSPSSSSGELETGSMSSSLGGHELSTNILQEHTCSLVMYGDSLNHAASVSKNKFSAMAKTVGYPVALAAELLLQHRKTLNLSTNPASTSISMDDANAIPFGVLLPTHKAIYEPILKACPSLGIHFKETITQIPTLFH